MVMGGAREFPLDGLSKGRKSPLDLLMLATCFKLSILACSDNNPTINQGCCSARQVVHSTLADGMEVNVMKGEPMHSNSLPLFVQTRSVGFQSIYD